MKKKIEIAEIKAGDVAEWVLMYATLEELENLWKFVEQEIYDVKQKIAKEERSSFYGGARIKNEDDEDLYRENPRSSV